jgi:alpha-amylase
MGVDGFRMDAVKFLMEDTGRADDVPGTHRVLREFAQHVRQVKADAFTVGEVFDSTGSLLSYYPDQLDSYFAFEVADSVIAAVRTGAAHGMLAPILRLQREVPAQRWSIFLRNHDQPRTATELRGDPAGLRLAAVLQFTLPGLPFVYYGEELGMTGAKPDERIRTPMAWSVDAPHSGFTMGTPWQRLQDDSVRANVGVQQGDTSSLLHLYRALIHLRASHHALGSGSLYALQANDSSVVSYVRRSGDTAVLVLANLGTRPVLDVAVDSDSALMPVGEYALRPLTGAPRVGPSGVLRVAQNGAFRNQRPGFVLAPRTAYVLDLVAVRR